MGEEFKLPYRANTANRDPVINYRDATLTVTYEHQQDDGEIVLGSIEFTRVLAYWYSRRLVCSAEEIVLAEAEQLNDSPWLRERLAHWKQYLGPQADPAKAKTFRHFQIYWDDIGHLSVIASGWRIVSPENPGRHT